MYPLLVQNVDNALHWIHQYAPILVSQTLDRDESSNSIIQRTTRPRIKPPTSRRQPVELPITYKNGQGFGLKINNKKNPAGGLEPRPARG